MDIVIRPYEIKDIPQLNEIWNEIVEERVLERS